MSKVLSEADLLAEIAHAFCVNGSVYSASQLGFTQFFMRKDMAERYQI